MTAEIPPMTHVLSRHWDQPDRRGILVDDTHALLSAKDWEKLAEYSGTIPSGVYEGKIWKRIECVRYYGRERNLVCWYGSSDYPEKCSVNFREAIIV